MKAKIKSKLRIVLIAIIVFYCITILYHKILTICFGDQFEDFQAIGMDHYMHPYEEDMRLCVLSYGLNHATVYFFSEDGGEKVRFVKSNNKWEIEEFVSIWSKSGNADETFVWPYYKHYVP